MDPNQWRTMIRKKDCFDSLYIYSISLKNTTLHVDYNLSIFMIQAYMRVMQSNFTKTNLKNIFKREGGGGLCTGTEYRNTSIVQCNGGENNLPLVGIYYRIKQVWVRPSASKTLLLKNDPVPFFLRGITAQTQNFQKKKGGGRHFPAPTIRVWF